MIALGLFMMVGGIAIGVFTFKLLKAGVSDSDTISEGEAKVVLIVLILSVIAIFWSLVGVTILSGA